MKNTIPSYKKVLTEDLYNKLPISEKRVVDEYLNYLKMKMNDESIQTRRRNLLHFRDVCQINFSDIDLKALRGFLLLLNQADYTNITKNEIKTQLKRFLRWKFKDWSKRFDEFKDLRLVKAGKCSQRINENNLLTPEELKLMMRASTNYRDKALLSFSYESGARPQEIRFLKWKEIKFDEDGYAKVQLYSGKTKESRTILVKDCVIELQDWKQHFQYYDVRDDDFVFPPQRTRNKPINSSQFVHIFQRIGKRAGINRPVFPYLNRHTRLNELYKKLPEQVHKKFSGHSRSSKMTEVYSHINSDDVVESLLSKVYKVEKLSPQEKNELVELKKKMDYIMKFIPELESIEEEKQKELENNLKIIRKLKNR